MQPFPQRLPDLSHLPNPRDGLCFDFRLVNYSLSSFSFLLLFPLLYCFTNNKACRRKQSIQN